MVFFDKPIRIRMRKEEFKRIKKIVKKNKLRFQNISHFFRCAIMEKIRREEELLAIPRKNTTMPGLCGKPDNENKRTHTNRSRGVSFDQIMGIGQEKD